MDGTAAMTESEKKILIIDPDANGRKVMAHFLKSRGYRVETGKNLTDALKRISRIPVSCVILDVDLKEMKGYEAVPVIKNIDPEMKIIMTTKKNTKRLEAKVREQDIFFYFIKSFDKEELALAINDAMKIKGG